MPGNHSKIGPSSAHRWRKCAGSVEESEGLPDSVGEEAIQGTVFHDFAEVVVEYGLDPFSLIGKLVECEDGKARPYTEEMAQGMLEGIDLIESYSNSEGVEVFVEVKVDLSEWLGPGMFGTADVIIVDRARKRMVVFDWKWGSGVPVHPEWNDQALCYALGAWSTIGRDIFEGVTPSLIDLVVVIEQPRAPGGGGVWRTNMAVVLAEGKKVREDADATREPNAARTPGETQCRFCPASRHNTCKARAEFAFATMGVMLDDLEEEFDLGAPLRLKDRRAFTPEQRSQVLLHQKMITDLIGTLHEEAMRDAERGLPVPGMKRIAGRSGARKWRDEEKAQELLVNRLGAEAYNYKLKTPAGIESEVGRARYRKDWERHVEKSEPGAILVPLSHPSDPLPDVDDILDKLLEE